MKLTQSQFEALISAGLTPKNHRLDGFAEACFDQNSYEDLVDFATRNADNSDLSAWGIDEATWREAQKISLESAMFDFVKFPHKARSKS